MNVNVSSPLSKVGNVAGNVVRNGTFQVVVGVLVVLGFVYWIGTKIGQKEIPQVEYPNKGAGLPAGWQAQAETLLQDCYDKLYGVFTAGSTKDALFGTLLALSDDQLVYMYNSFNARYFRLHNETLTQAIDAEWLFDYTSDRKSKLINRMKSLKLA